MHFWKALDMATRAGKPNFGRTFPTTLGLVAGLLSASVGNAQPEQKPSSPPATSEAKPAPRPADDPSLTNPGSEDALLDTQKRPAPPPPIKPTRERPGQRPMPAVPQPSANIPGLSAFDFNVPGAKRYPEGTFLLTRKGVVVQSETGEFVFVPAKDGEAAGERGAASTLAEMPLVLMPSQRLSQLTTKVTSPADSVAVSVSGQVFAYRDRQYLLLSMFNFESAEVVPVAKPKATSSVEAPAKRAGARASAQELMGDLEHRGGTARAMGENPAAASAPLAPGASEVVEGARSTRGVEHPAGSLRVEGTVMTGKRGRIVRVGADRAIAIAVDNDPDSPGALPMPLLPCRVLEVMEALVGQRGDSLQVKFSGRVTVYQGKNFLLPTMYQVIRTGDVTPMQ